MLKIIGLLIVFCLFPSLTGAQITSSIATRFREYTFATKPTAPRAGTRITITDCDTTECIAGGGSIRADLRWTGSAYEVVAAVGGVGGGANTTLSNLGVTAINAHLLFNADNTYDVGSSTNAVRTLYYYTLVGKGSTTAFEGPVSACTTAAASNGRLHFTSSGPFWSYNTGACTPLLKGDVAVTVAQGGTGSATATAARSALNIRYQIGGSPEAFSPADGVVYYAGGQFPPTTDAGDLFTHYVGVGVAGTAKRLCVMTRNPSVLGTNENVVMVLRKNQATDSTENVTQTWDAVNVGPTCTNLTTAFTVAADDKITLKITSPTWTTNPTSVRLVWWVSILQDQ